jgi:hypothetical protein
MVLVVSICYLASDSLIKVGANPKVVCPSNRSSNAPLNKRAHPMTDLPHTAKSPPAKSCSQDRVSRRSLHSSHT